VLFCSRAYAPFTARHAHVSTNIVSSLSATSAHILASLLLEYLRPVCVLFAPGTARVGCPVRDKKFFRLILLHDWTGESPRTALAGSTAWPCIPLHPSIHLQRVLALATFFFCFTFICAGVGRTNGVARAALLCFLAVCVGREHAQCRQTDVYFYDLTVHGKFKHYVNTGLVPAAPETVCAQSFRILLNLPFRCKRSFMPHTAGASVSKGRRAVVTGVVNARTSDSIFRDFVGSVNYRSRHVRHRN
jgi:hypothetical protein